MILDRQDTHVGGFDFDQPPRVELRRWRSLFSEGEATGAKRENLVERDRHIFILDRLANQLRLTSLSGDELMSCD